VTGTIMTIVGTLIWLLMGVCLDMSHQQSLALECLVTFRPVTSVAHPLGMLLNIVVTQVSLAHKCNATTHVGIINFFMHGVLVSLHVISTVAYISTLGIRTDERCLVIPLLALGRGQLGLGEGLVSLGVDESLLLVVLMLLFLEILGAVGCGIFHGWLLQLWYRVVVGK